MIDNLIYRKSISSLNKRVKSLKRNKTVHNLTTARSIGIVFQAKTRDDLLPVKSLMERFMKQNINVRAMGYHGAKEVPALLQNEAYPMELFCKNETNWYHQPTSEKVLRFAREELDILIDLSFDEVLSLRWLTTLSMAKFKVGALNYHQNPFDLILTIDKKNGLSYLCEQVEKVLYEINNRFAE